MVAASCNYRFLSTCQGPPLPDSLLHFAEEREKRRCALGHFLSCDGVVTGCDGKCYRSDIYKSLIINICYGVMAQNPCGCANRRQKA